MQIFLILFLSLAIGGGWSQAPEPTIAPERVVITVDNVTELQPVASLDADDLLTDATLASGWFTLSPDGTTFAAVTRSNEVAIFDASGLIETYGLTSDVESPTVLCAFLG
jgi:hypothetical protein